MAQLRLLHWQLDIYNNRAELLIEFLTAFLIELLEDVD